MQLMDESFDQQPFIESPEREVAAVAVGVSILNKRSSARPREWAEHRTRASQLFDDVRGQPITPQVDGAMFRIRPLIQRAPDPPRSIRICGEPAHRDAQAAQI